MPETCPDTNCMPAGHTKCYGAWGEYLVLVFILAVGLLLRVQHLDAVTTWFDESFGWRMVQFSPAEILLRSELDVHPPAYFLVLKVWGQLFGDSLASLRSCAVLFGLLTILGAYVVVRDVTVTDRCVTGSGFAALLAALFVALSPPHVYWSQQIKMYTFGTALAVWSTWFLLGWFQTRDYWKLCFYVPLAAGLALQHHYGAFTVFGQLSFALARAVYLWWKESDKQLMSVIIAAWITTALWALWLPALLYQRNQVVRQYWISKFDWQSIVDVWMQLFSFSEYIQPAADISWTVGNVVWLVIAVLLSRRELGIRCIGWLTLAPYLLAFGWSSILHNVIAARYLIFAHVFLLMGIAVLIGLIPVKWLRYCVAVLAIAGFCWTAQGRWKQREAEAQLPGMREVVQVLRDVRSTEEPVLVCNPMMYLNVLVYGTDLPKVYAYDPGSPFPHFQGTPVMKKSDYCNLAALKEMNSEWLWTIDAEQWLVGDWKVSLPPEWKLRHERRVREWYATLVLRSYRREPGFFRR